jgi:hypothetical protein
LKTEVGETKINNSSDEIPKNSVSSKDSSESKTSGISKTASVKMKKIRGDLSLCKLGSSTDKSTRGCEITSPTKPVESRRSKILKMVTNSIYFLKVLIPSHQQQKKLKRYSYLELKLVTLNRHLREGHHSLQPCLCQLKTLHRKKL